MKWDLESKPRSAEYVEGCSFSEEQSWTSVNKTDGGEGLVITDLECYSFLIFKPFSGYLWKINWPFSLTFYVYEVGLA